VTAPEVSVVVASHDRTERLETLFDALGRQTLPRERWELVVVHTYAPAVAARLLEGHELAQAGVLRHIPLDPSRARPSLQRNAGWRAASGTLIAFTDDDCRPDPHWLERLVGRHGEAPGSIVQGATFPDPREEHLFVRPHVRTLRVHPPGRFTQTCNILYERELIQRVGGLDDRAITGEDIDLGIRARDAGARLVGAPEAVVYHAIEALSLVEKIRSQHKWQHLAYVVKRHPRLRSGCLWGIWWKRDHLRALIVLAALLAAPRRPWALVGLVPYLQRERYRHGRGKRAQLRATREMPAHWVVDLAELATFVAGSVRYRTILL
jgi:glycosyltransferase involved in cell wall biosynthesis